jgi:RimJ/RimL family protein N-acetyltransferase
VYVRLTSAEIAETFVAARSDHGWSRPKSAYTEDVTSDAAWIVEGYWARLRMMREEDAEAVVEWRNRPHNARWVQRESLTVTQHLKWLVGARGRREALLIFASPEGVLFGTCAFYGFDPARTSAEYGRLCSAEPGIQAVGMIEGIYLAHRVAFEVLGTARLHCACAATTPAG